MKHILFFKPALLIMLFSCFAFTQGSGYRQEKPISLKDYRDAVKDKVVLVYFSAGWCNVCGKFKPVISQIENDYAGKIKVLRIDTERDNEVAEEFDVNTLPLLMLYKNGKLAWSNSGIIELSSLRREIDCYL
jgi:thioredoxin 1